MLIAEKREQIGGITAIPGAVNLLKNLPQHSWAVVTSADWGLAANRLEITGIPEAPMLIATEDVAHGKPNPDGFQLAAQNLVSPQPRLSSLKIRRAGCLVRSPLPTPSGQRHRSHRNGLRVSAPFESNMMALRRNSSSPYRASARQQFKFTISTGSSSSAGSNPNTWP